MILQALASYHQRSSDKKTSDKLAQLGWISKLIDFAIVIDRTGRFVTVDDLRETKDGKHAGKLTFVPNIGKQAQKHTNSGKDANLLWDDVRFILGRKAKGKTTMEAFCRTVEEFFPTGQTQVDAGIEAMRIFCREHLMLDSVREEIAVRLPQQKNGELLPGIAAFRLEGDLDFISDRETVKNILNSYVRGKDLDGFCCVTGERASISKNHTVLKNVKYGQSSGVSLVSFNCPAFTSYNKKAGANAPVGEAAMFAYTTALNHLLESGSNQRMQVGDASTVFWSEKPSDLEETFSGYFTEPPKDDPDRGTHLVRALYESVRKGSLPESDKTNRFYVLGLSPNAARVAVRFWIVGTVEKMKKNIDNHFKYIRIAHGPGERDEISLFRLLVQTAVQGKADNIPKNLAGDVMRSIMEGLPYPQTALSALLRRVRAERYIPHPRAAFLKACINHSQENKKEKELDVSLDTSNPNVGYRLGRLFAALEKTQQEALPGIKATIRDRFYGSASSTPAAVFPTLIRTSKHHLGKLDEGQRIHRERLIGEIVNGIPPEFPDVLTLPDQGRFAIGYYHQMQEFYAKKTPATEAEAAEAEAMDQE